MVVLKLTEDSIVECSHSISPPGQPLIHATGGVLVALDTDEPVAVVCGGEVLNSNNAHVPNKECFTLTDDQKSQFSISAGGITSDERIGSASLIVDAGSALWVTGGLLGEWGRVDSEIITVSENQSFLAPFPTSAAGPDFQFAVFHHCLLNIGPHMAVVTGGRFKLQDEEEGNNTFDLLVLLKVLLFGSLLPSELPNRDMWSIDMRTMSWVDEQRHLAYGRLKHACGVLRTVDDMVVLVVAGGIGNFNTIISTVETLLVYEASSGHISFAITFELGPSLPVPLAGMASTTSADHRSLYVMGGQASDDISTRRVYKLSYPETTTQPQQLFWTKVDYELQLSSAMAVALAMPRSTIASRKYHVTGRDCTNKGKYLRVGLRRWLAVCIGLIYIGLMTEESGSVMLVTTGWNDYRELGDTEAFYVVLSSTTNSDNLDRCQYLSHTMAQTMHALEGATGGVLQREISDNKQQYLPIICGGLSPQISNDKCFRLEESDSGLPLPIEAGRKRELRKGAASVSIWSRTALWITGGEMAAATESTEWMDVSSDMATGGSPLPPLQWGIPLPIRMAYHCLEMITDSVVILYGGTQWYVGQDSLHQAWTIDNLNDPEFIKQMTATENHHHDSNLWTPRASMEQGRSGHICGVIRVNESIKFVVAAGGETLDTYTNNVELLKVDTDAAGNVIGISNSWEQGPNLPYKVSRAASATTEDQAMLFFAGGHRQYDFGYYGSNFIHSFRCAQTGFCFWQEEKPKMITKRRYGLALIIPPMENNIASTITNCKLISNYS